MIVTPEQARRKAVAACQTADPQCAAVLRPVRAGGHWRADPR
jgi:hypothetical protein